MDQCFQMFDKSTALLKPSPDGLYRVHKTQNRHQYSRKRYVAKVTKAQKVKQGSHFKRTEKTRSLLSNIKKGTSGSDDSELEMPSSRDGLASAKSRAKSAKSHRSITFKRNNTDFNNEREKSAKITNYRKSRRVPRATEISDMIPPESKASPAYGVYISQLIRYGRACSNYEDFIARGQLLTTRLQQQGYTTPRLKSTFRKFFGRQHDIVGLYEKSASELLEQTEPEEKNMQFVAENLRDYSRQRLRAVHMSLRHYSTVESRISQKDLTQSLQENNVKISNRIYQLLVEKFEDQHGVDFEKLYRYITDAHAKSGRDSVQAMQCRNDLECRQEMTSEEKDNDLLRRLEELLVKGNTFFDLPDLREAFQAKDKHKTGRVEKSDVFDICGRRNSPLYGALLKSLVKRCDGENTGLISWPQFISFLERSQQNVWKKFPEMEQLPVKAKEQEKAQADPIVELSEHTKSKLMSKLLKKTSQLKVNKTGNPSKSETKISGEETKPDTKTKTVIEMSVEKNTTPTNENHPNTPNGNAVKDEPANQTTRDESKPKDTKEDSPVDQDLQPPEINNTDLETKPVTMETKEKLATMLPPGKTQQDLKKVSSLVKTSSGFLSSVRTFISGKKKLEADDSNLTAEMDTEKIAESKDGKPEVKNKAVPTEKEEKKPQPLDDPNMLCIHRKGKTIKFPKPENYDKQSVTLEPPKERLALDWVYGYRGNDCRSNIHVLGNGEIVYYVSKIAVLYDRANHRQRHYREHTEDIKSIALHSNLSVIATGQFAGVDQQSSNIQAHIRIWRVDNLQTLHVLGRGRFEKAVMCLAFAKDRDILAAVDNSPEKTLSVWDITSGQNVAEMLLSTDVICDIGFNTRNPDVLVSTGKEHLTWWKVYPESSTIQVLAQPDYDTYLRAKYIICLIHNDKGDLITGDSNGTIYIWGDCGNKITNFIKHAHDGPVFTILSIKGMMFSGGRDSMVYCWLWNKNMDCAGKLQIPKSEGGVRMLQIHCESLLIGTTVNSMLSTELSSQQGAPLNDVVLDAIPITQGHFDDLRGLSLVTKSEMGGNFVTAGLDGIICWFDAERRDPVCKLVLKGLSFLCVDSSPSGKLIVLGTADGHVILIQIEGDSSVEILNKKLCKDRLKTVKFSPDCRSIAAGSQNKGVYLLALQQTENSKETWEFTGKYKGHDGAVTNVDWSRDIINGSYLIKSCSLSPDYNIWRTDTLNNVTDLDPGTITWATYNCRFDASIAGLWWSKQAEDGDINCVDINHTGSLVALGDNNGYLSLFRHPCVRRGAFCHTYKSHTSVKNVLFVGDQGFVVTVGGRDSCVLQWRIE